MSRPDLEPTQPIPTVPLGPTAWPQPPAPEPEPEPGPGPLARLVGWLGRLLLLLLALAVVLVGAALLLTPARESVLIMGSDARPDEQAQGELGRTDTLLLLVADRAAPRVAMVSVPRDLWVGIPGHGSERINAAYELGGPQTAKQTVSNVLGQRVDRFALIGLQGVREVVDAVGGVDISVPQAIHDETYPTDDYGYQTVDIPAGRQHMDGDTALKYARTRHQDNDFGRIARQQQVVAAVRAAMLNPLNWPRLPAALGAIQRSITSDVSPLDAAAIAAAFVRAPGDPDRLVIDTSLADPITGEDGAYLLEAKPTLRSTVARFLGAASSAPATVEVLNGAGVAGLARATADRLGQQGYSVTSIADADRPQRQTTILVRPGARAMGEQVAGTLNMPANRVSESASIGPADVRVILGADAG